MSGRRDFLPQERRELLLAIGLTLAAHGTQKLFGWFGGGGFAAFGLLGAALAARSLVRHTTFLP